MWLVGLVAMKLWGFRLRGRWLIESIVIALLLPIFSEVTNSVRPSQYFLEHVQEAQP